MAGVVRCALLAVTACVFFFFVIVRAVGGTGLCFENFIMNCRKTIKIFIVDSINRDVNIYRITLRLFLL